MRPKYKKNQYGEFIKIEEVPFKIDHINSQEEYNGLKTEQNKNIFIVKDHLSQSIGQIQSKILNVNIHNINETFDYYFNSKTSRVDAYLDQLFVQSFKQIKDILRNRRNVPRNKAKNDIVLAALTQIKKNFLNQHTYIKDIQERTSNLKRDHLISNSK